MERPAQPSCTSAMSSTRSTRTCSRTWLSQASNQLRALEITIIPMAYCFVTLTCGMDIYSRKSLPSRILNTQDVSFCIEMVSSAVRFYPQSDIINTDPGWQHLSGAFVTAVTASGAKLSMHDKDAWTDKHFTQGFGTHKGSKRSL